MAATAAIRAGLDFEITVPVWSGRVTLPGLGQATLHETSPMDTHGDPWGIAAIKAQGDVVEISNGRGTISIPRTDEVELDGWRGLKSIHAEVPGDSSGIHIALDHFNPYRGAGEPIPPDDPIHNLDRLHEERWLAQLADGAGLLVRDHPGFAKVLAGVVRSVFPQTDRKLAIRFRPQSASSGDMIGAVEMSPPHDPRELAGTLVHEGYHNILNAIMLATPLFQKDPARPDRIEELYAPWRDDPRHAFGLLHGIVSFLGVARFWQERIALETPDSPEARLAQFEVAHWRQQLPAAIAQLEARPDLFTTEGRAFVNDILIPGIDSLQTQELPPEIRQVADIAVVYHRARWAAHHLGLDQGMVEAFAHNWTKQAPISDKITETHTLQFEPRARNFDTWALLARLSVVEPNILTEMHQDPNKVTEYVPGATKADIEYFAGNVEEARDLYIAVLQTPDGFDDPHDIVGLGFTLSDGAARQLLLHRPQVYRGVQRQVVALTGSPADPMQLARWLGGEKPKRATT
jgi:HEXXH motif-containing protein